MGVGLQEVVDLTSQLLGTPAVLEDRDFNLVAFHTQAPEIDVVRQRSILERGSSAEVRSWFEQFGIATAAGPVSTPADPERGTLGRLCIPARWNGVNHGYLWVLDPGGRLATDPAVEEAARLAEHAGALLAQRVRGRQDVSILLESLMSPDEEVAAQAADDLGDRGLVATGDPVCVVEARLLPAGATAPVNVWTLPRNVLATARPGHASLLVRLSSPAAATAGLAEVRRVTTEIRQQRNARSVAGDRSRLVLGIGEPQPSLLRARVSQRQAILATQVAAADPSVGDTVAWSDLGVHRLLACRPESSLAAAVLDDPVQTLLDQPEPHLAQTALTYLREAGSIQRTAVELGLHRQTVYYRLHRIAELTGLDLSDGRDRLRLHLGLELAPMLTRPSTRD